MSKIEALSQLENILSKYLNFEKTPKKDALWLKNMEILCDALDNPQNFYKSFHVAGSKGKGSVSSFIASILSESQFSTGIFTSPHVSDISERVRDPFAVFDDAVYENALANFCKIQDFIDNLEKNGGNKATWFELFTIYSFLCFKHAHVDWAVFEVGLGGRLDSTNVILPEACIITPIELEHTEFLGDTIEQVAFEKAGIIKKGIPVFSAKQCVAVRKVFEKRAKEVGATITFIDDENPFLQLFSQIDLVDLNLKGAIQKENAKLAALVVKSIIPTIADEVILAGLKKATIPCRFQIEKSATKNITLVLDGCHTPNSLSLCLQTFYEEFGPQNELLFACASDKDVMTMAKIINDSECNFSQINITEPGGVKSGNFAKTTQAFETYCNSNLVENKNYAQAIECSIKNAEKNGKVLLCVGSFYLCAEVLKIIDSID